MYLMNYNILVILMKKVIVIGGGASGIIASLKLATKKYDVYLLERNSFIGKKLLVTGNGRCNYWNSNIDSKYYYTDNNNILEKLLSRRDEVFKFLSSLGIYPRIKNSLYYPYSNEALSVQKIFESQLLNSKVNLITNFKVEKIIKVANKFKCISENKDITGDILVIATGGLAYPKTGSDGILYPWLRKQNIKVNALNPALVPLFTEGDFLKKWAGIRSEAKIKLYIDSRYVKEEEGEIQLTKDGISGICVFNISSLVAKALSNKKDVQVRIDFLPNIDDLNSYLLKRIKLLKNGTILNLLYSLINIKLIDIISKKANIDINTNINKIDSKKLDCLIDLIKNFTIKITSIGDYNMAQVTTGGVSLEEINPNTLEVSKVSNLYLCGEILDVDGICGGYNLAFAFISGYIVGDSIND